MADWASLAALGEFGGTLELVLLVGPDLRGEEGLRLAREHLPKERPTRWVYLDEEGPDLARALEENRSAVVLAHGLEYMAAAERHEVERSLNLLRDTLAGQEGIIVLWVPLSDVEGFRVRCADLFQWRSLLLVATAEDVPIAAAEEKRREDLVHFRNLELKWPFLPNVEVGGDILPFAEWAGPLLLEHPPSRIGFLRDYPAQRRSEMLTWLAVVLAPRALRHRGPLPLLLHGPSLFAPFPDYLYSSNALDQHGIVELVDTVNGYPFSEEFLQQRPSEPVRFTLVAVRPGMDLAGRWLTWLEQRSIAYVAPARLLPWSLEQLVALATWLGVEQGAERLARECRDWLGGLCFPAFASDYLFRSWSAERMNYFDAWVTAHMPSDNPPALIHGWPAVFAGKWPLPPEGTELVAPSDEAAFVARGILDRLLYVGMLDEAGDGRFVVRPHFLWSYFAASELLGSGDGALDILALHLDDPRWRDVIIMVVARLSRLSTDREALWEKRLWPLLWPDLPVPRRMALALQAAVDAGLALEELAPWLRAAEAALEAGHGIEEDRAALSDALQRARLQ